MKRKISVESEDDLAKALKENEDTIEIRGDLADKVIRIKATGTAAWIIAVGAIAVAVTAVIMSGGAAAPASGIVGIAAVSVLGLPATTTAVLIAIAAGGVGVLQSLRDYKIENSSDGYVILKRY